MTPQNSVVTGIDVGAGGCRRIEAGQALEAANREPITCFKQEIQATLARIWSDAKTP